MFKFEERQVDEECFKGREGDKKCFKRRQGDEECLHDKLQHYRGGAGVWRLLILYAIGKPNMPIQLSFPPQSIWDFGRSACTKRIFNNFRWIT